MAHNYYIGDSRYSEDAPHYITCIDSDWKQRHPTRADAQHWLEIYGVSENYKQEHYHIISVAEFYDKMYGNRPLRAW